MTVEKKRKKERFLEEAIMESEKTEAHVEPVVMKRKRMTGHSFKARFKEKRPKEIVPDKSPVRYQETEEQVQSIDSKKRCLKLKVICPQDSQNSTDSGRGQLLTEADINQEKSNVDEDWLCRSPLNLKIVKNKIKKASTKEQGHENTTISKMKRPMNGKGARNGIEKDSSKEKHYENQSLSWKKQSLKDRGAENEIGGDSSREEDYENEFMLKQKQAAKDKVADNEIEKVSAREERLGNQVISEQKKAVKDRGAENEIGEDSSRGEHCDNQIVQKQKQTTKNKVADNEIEMDSTREGRYINQVISQQKQAMKDKGEGNRIEKNSSLEQHCENQIPSKKKQVATDKYAGYETEKGSSSVGHCKNQIPSKRTQLATDKYAGNEVEKGSSREEHCENRILPWKKQAVKDKGAGNEINKGSAREECFENQMTLEQKGAVEIKGVGNEVKKDSSCEEHCENHILTKKKQAVMDTHAGNEVGKGSSREEHCENQILPQKKQAVKDKGAGEKGFAREECFENQIISEQKQAVHGNGEGSEIDGLINRIQKNCDRRMKRLNKNQQQEIQNFHRIWEEKRSVLEKDHKLGLSLIRYIHCEDLARMFDKLKFSNGKFARKIEEFNLLKDMELKDLEAKHLAAINEEREKEANWLARARACCSSELRDVCGPQSLCLQSEEVGRFSQSSSQDVVLLTMHSLEYKNPSKIVQENDIALSEKSVCTDPQNEIVVAFSQGTISDAIEQLNQLYTVGSKEILCGLPSFRGSVPGEILPVELNIEVPPQFPEIVSIDIDYTNSVELGDGNSNAGFDKVDETGLIGALVMQQDKADEIAISDLPLVGQRVAPDAANENQSAEINEEVLESVPNGSAACDNPVVLESVPNGSVACGNPVDLGKNNSDDGIDEGYVISLPDAFVNQGDETAETITSGLLSVGQILMPSELQVSGDQIHQGLTCPVIPDQGAQVVEQQNTSPFEEDASEDVDNMTSEESIAKLRNGDGPVVEDQVNSQIDVTITKLIDSVNSLQNEGAQVVEMKNTSPSETDTSKDVEHVTCEESTVKLQYVNPAQDEGAQLVEKQKTSPFDVSASDHVDTVTMSPSNMQERDVPVVEEQVALQIEVANSKLVNTVNPVLSDGAPPIGNGEKMHIVSSHVSSSTCNRPTPIEFGSQSHNLKRNSSQTTQIKETEVVPQESPFHSGSSQKFQSNHLDLGSESGVAHQTNIELSTSSPSNGPIPRTVVSTFELLHQANLQRGSVAHLYGPSYLSGESPPLLAEALENELERIHKETEQLQKTHEDMVAQLRSDREKERGEIIAQIHKKYELKLRDAEAEFSMKKNELDKNHKKVIQNKLLSEVLGSTCSGFWSFGLPEIHQHQVIPSSSMQQLPLQHLMRPPPSAAFPGQPSPSPLMAGPNLQSTQQLLQPHFPRPNHTASQNFATSPIQTPRHAAPFSFSSTSRPPIISAITTTGRNPHFSGEISFRTSPPSSSSQATFLPITHLPPPAFVNRPQL